MLMSILMDAVMSYSPIRAVIMKDKGYIVLYIQEGIILSYYVMLYHTIISSCSISFISHQNYSK